MSDLTESSTLERLVAEVASLRHAVAKMADLRGERLTRAEVCGRLGVHRNTLRTYIDARDFPKPGRDGKWLLSEVLEWEGRR